MRNKFAQRSRQTELIDSEQITEQLFFKNLGEFDFLNRNLGGHAISLEGIKKLINSGEKQYTIADLGCGSGDSLKYFAKWARKENIQLNLIGVDKNPSAIKYLRLHCSKYNEITGIHSDFNTFLNSSEPVDIIHCSLFCHHLNDNDFTELLNRLKKSTKVGFVINDLQRSKWAYYAVKLLTFLLNGSSLSKNDGPVSVLRGFTHQELHEFLKIAEIEKYRIFKRRGFRFLIVVRTN